MAAADNTYNPLRTRRIRRIAKRLTEETERPLNFRLALLRLSPYELAAVERLIELCEHTPADRPIRKPTTEDEAAAANKAAA